MVKKNNIDRIEIENSKKARATYEKFERLMTPYHPTIHSIKGIVYVDRFNGTSTIEYLFFNVNGSTVRVEYNQVNSEKLYIDIISDNRESRRKAKNTLIEKILHELN